MGGAGAGAETEAELRAARGDEVLTEAREDEPETEHIAVDLSEPEEVPEVESPGAAGDVSLLVVTGTSWGIWKSKKLAGRP